MSAYSSIHLISAYGDAVSMKAERDKFDATITLRIGDAGVSLTLSREQFAQLSRLAHDLSTEPQQEAA